MLLWRVTLRWKREIVAALAPLELTHAQFVLLASSWWIGTHQDELPTQRQVAAQAGTDPMMTSQVLRALEARGLLTREQTQAMHGRGESPSRRPAPSSRRAPSRSWRRSTGSSSPACRPTNSSAPSSSSTAPDEPRRGTAPLRLPVVRTVARVGARLAAWPIRQLARTRPPPSTNRRG